ncbi:MAG TPA: hypothetical protein VHJ37_03175 [Thermoleophilaceae bacterium]|nr:hypothetical protein [Thermoleophilaceae bacterium]
MSLRTQTSRLPDESELLRRAKRRLDRLDFYPEPVSIDGVRIRIAPWLFRIPGFRRFRGYATRRNIWLKRPAPDERLIAHELCHVWQLQHRPLRVWLSYVRPSTFSSDRTAYRANRYEVEARVAANGERAVPASERVTPEGPVRPIRPAPRWPRRRP